MYDAVNEVVEMPIEVDELFEEAVRICVDMKRASTSVSTATFEDWLWKSRGSPG